jgi:hypothetical protein
MSHMPRVQPMLQHDATAFAPDDEKI